MHKTVHYLSLDPLQNLRIKVTLKKVQGARPLQNENKEGVQNLPPGSQVQMKEPLPDGMAVTLRWQEKRFGPREVFDYEKMSQNAGATLSVLDQHNLNEIQEARKEAAVDGHSFEGHTIHTMVHRDDYVDLPDLFRKYTTSAREEPNILTRKLLDPGEQTHGKQGVQPTPAEKNEAVGHKSHKKLLEHDMQVMYILASFTNTGPAQELLAQADQQHFWMGETHPLCAIRALTNNSFDMQPGFSGEGVEPYRFTLLDGSIYEYELENLSTVPERVAKLGRPGKDSRNTREAQRRQLELRKNIVGQEFTTPPYRKGIINLHSFSEIVSVTGFDTDDSIFLDYTIQLPMGWKTEPADAPLQGVTQMSKVDYIKTFRDIDEQAVAHMCFPLTHNFIYEGLTDHRGEHQETNDIQTLSPRIFFQVTSVDFWLRQRALGYGTLSLPLTPGFHQMDIQTWRPAGSIRTWLKEFYIGGSYELSDIQSAEAPPDFEGHLLNKYGFRAESGGTIKFRTNIVTQTHVPKKPKEKKSFRNLVSKHQKAGIAHLSARVAQIKKNIGAAVSEKEKAMGRVKSRQALQAAATGSGGKGTLASLVSAVNDVKKQGGDTSVLQRTSILSRTSSIAGSPGRPRESRQERLARIRAQREASKGKKA